MSRLPVGVVGATGLAGQQFLAALADHPFFEIVRLAASERSAGKRYLDAIRDPQGAVKWYSSETLSPAMADIMVESGTGFDPKGLAVVFTAVESDAAHDIEPHLAEKVPVISTASAFRYEPDVPIFIAGVNMDHAGLIDQQRKRRGWKGFVTPVPNCTATGLAMSLAPLHHAYGIAKVIMTSMQACSGAGRTPGVVGIDIIDNVIPFIANEEEKVQTETQKILGQLEGQGIRPADFPVSATCTRVPVLEGHTESVFVSLRQSASVEQVKAVMREWGASFVALGLPSAPKHLIVVQEDPFRPQPRMDRDAGAGMATTVGRVRLDPALDRGVKYVLVSHNTKMGAAKGAVLIGEYLAKKGYIG